MPQVDSPDWSAPGVSAVYIDPNSPHAIAVGGSLVVTADVPPSARSMGVIFDDETAVASFVVRDGLTQAILIDATGPFTYGYFQIPLPGPTSNAIQLSGSLYSGKSVNVWLVFYDATVTQLIQPQSAVEVDVKAVPKNDLHAYGLSSGSTAASASIGSGSANGLTVERVQFRITGLGTAQTSYCRVYDGSGGSGTLLFQALMVVPATADTEDTLEFADFYCGSGYCFVEFTTAASANLESVNIWGRDL